MSNYPVIEQSTCSTVINYAILYFCKTYRDLGKLEKTTKPSPSGKSQCPDHLRGEDRQRRDKGRVTSQGFTANSRLPRVGSKSSLSGMSLNPYWPFHRLLLGLYSALLLGLIIESVACRYNSTLPQAGFQYPNQCTFQKKEGEDHTLICSHDSFQGSKIQTRGAGVPTDIAPKGNGYKTAGILHWTMLGRLTRGDDQEWGECGL